ncbi:MAG: DUF6056 family protein [Lachnospiraceae bacterium]|nr:DUF6056 family protein [Lachnospiraceae bacterium]MCM1238142.1 DUF6056 family protein [Lachnospiraceae bacterium]
MTVKEKSRRAMRTITGILVFASILVMYLTHRAVPFMMDDLWYSTMLSDATPIASFSDIVKSQIWHYNNWGGRSMTHGILQITLLMGERAADILNVVMMMLLSVMACMMARYKNLPAFWAAMAMLLGLNANWKMSMFWQAGAANYLYITVFILLFMWCYLRELPEDGEAPKRLWGISLWIVPLGILAGWSNENMGPVAWLLSLAVMALAVREKRKLSAWMILGSLGCLAGSVMVIAAPGNFVRSAQAPDREYGFLWRCFLRGYAESTAAVEYLFPALLVTGVMFILCKGVLKQSLGQRNVLLLLGALLSWGAMILSPHYPDRATFGTMVLLICVILSLAGKVLAVRKDLAWMLWGLTALIWLRGMYHCGEFLAITWGWIR